MWITAVNLDGEPVDLDDALASLVIRHGRSDAFSDPTSSSAQLSIRGMTRADTLPFRVGVPLEVRAGDDVDDDFARFTGLLTDAALVDDVLTVIATGPLRRSAAIGSAPTTGRPRHGRRA